MISRKHPVAARILRSWRQLSLGGEQRDSERPTLIACSGGMDSVLLATVLASVNAPIRLVHVVHNIRSQHHAEQDRDLVISLAEKLNLEVDIEYVDVISVGGNVENNARKLRYGAFTKIAHKYKYNFLATAHHADDQLETLLMRLLRGSSVSGFVGIHEKRTLDHLTIIRPMLGVHRQEIEQLVHDHHIPYIHDHTNDDVQHLRNAVRHQVVPVLKKIEPEIATRAQRLSSSCAAHHDLVRNIVENEVLPLAICDSCHDGYQRFQWKKADLAMFAEVVLYTLIRYVNDQLHKGARRDRLTMRSMESVVRSVKSANTDPREYRIGPMIVGIRSGVVEFYSSSLSS